MLEGAQEGGKGTPFVRLLILPFGAEVGGKLLLLNLLLVHFLVLKEGGNGFLLFLQFQGEQGKANKCRKMQMVKRVQLVKRRKVDACP